MTLLASISAVTSVAGCATDSVFSKKDERHMVDPPARVFVPSLRECPPEQEAISVRYAGNELLGKSIAFRGVLTLDQGRSCNCDGCPADEWRVVEAEARVYDVSNGRPTTALLVWLPVLLPGDDLGSPDLDVIATGVLRKIENRGERNFKYTEFLLEGAEVCRVKPSSLNHADPFPHPPRIHGRLCVPD